jgi:osmotically-inducible protein OsmY
MYKNSPLENDVNGRLADDPRIADSAEIAVASDGGIVTLRGTVERFPQRRAAEDVPAAWKASTRSSTT